MLFQQNFKSLHIYNSNLQKCIHMPWYHILNFILNQKINKNKIKLRKCICFSLHLTKHKKWNEITSVLIYDQTRFRIIKHVQCQIEGCQYTTIDVETVIAAAFMNTHAIVLPYPDRRTMWRPHKWQARTKQSSYSRVETNSYERTAGGTLTDKSTDGTNTSSTVREESRCSKIYSKRISVWNRTHKHILYSYCGKKGRGKHLIIKVRKDEACGNTGQWLQTNGH